MFITDLITNRDMSKDYCWILEEDLIYQSSKYIIIIKKGFDFDFASIPWFIEWLLPKNGVKYDRSSCLHDGLFASNLLPFEECNSIFKEASLEDRVNPTIANIMYWAVSLFGQSAYKSSEEELQKYRQLVSITNIELR